MAEKFNLNAEELKKREVRSNELDSFYSLEGGVTFREKLESVRNTVESESNEARVLQAVLEGPVAYLEMPDRYDLSDMLAEMDNEEFRELRESVRRRDPGTHALLEQQRLRMNTINHLYYPIVFSQMYNIGDQERLRELEMKYEQMRELVIAKEHEEQKDHRVMTDEEKDAIVREVSSLARDIILFTLEAVAPRES